MKRNYYKIAFFSLLALNLFVLFYIFLSTKSDFSTTEYTETSKSDTLSALKNDTLTEEAKKMHRLVDSTKMVKDSINKVITFMNDSIDLKSLPHDQIENYNLTINILSGIRTQMDLTLDLSRLELLKTDFSQLQVIIKKYDKKRERIGKLSEHLASLTKFIKAAVDVFVTAVSEGIIVTPSPSLSK